MSLGFVTLTCIRARVTPALPTISLSYPLPSSVCSWRELPNHPTPYRTLIRASAGLRKNAVPRAFQNCSRVAQLPGSTWRLRSTECIGDGCARTVIGDVAAGRERSRTGGRDLGCSVYPVPGPCLRTVGCGRLCPSHRCAAETCHRFVFGLARASPPLPLQRSGIPIRNTN